MKQLFHCYFGFPVLTFRIRATPRNIDCSCRVAPTTEAYGGATYWARTGPDEIGTDAPPRADPDTTHVRGASLFLPGVVIRTMTSL
ncbi:hypothetical protein F2P81_003142 [Scophthalmus maximus]|uniref:Uncharacterized protein n=1 Tax=Scophthalmus maximus TaxID=52904 RepID=A0A6A4TLA4_SCOMX|nr:hypothetical protein F2P81_003142 [Scophthalmus maximus]